MNATPKLPRRHPVTSAVAAVLSVVIALALLGSVTELFQRDGTPFAQLVAAERACTNYAYASEREACVRMCLATASLAVLAHHDRLRQRTMSPMTR